MGSFRAMVCRAKVWTLVLPLALAACATYKDDLERARARYTKNEHEHAIALLEALDHDIDSLSEAERAQFSYLRGMSHHRLAHEHDARHWLAVALAREKASQGSLQPDEKKRAEEVVEQLNAAWWGGKTALEDAQRCKADDDCARGEFCDAGSCAKAGAAPRPKRRSDDNEGAGSDDDAPREPKKRDRDDDAGSDDDAPRKRKKNDPDAE